MGGFRTRIKVCGLTRSQDITSAVSLGADAIGLVFYPKSRRYVNAEQAAELRKHVPAFVSVVGLFVNANPQTVESVIDTVKPNLLQFHGDESPGECWQYGLPYIKAFRVGGPDSSDPDEILQMAMKYKDASGWLFDTFSPDYGGSGESFEHGLLRKVIGHNESRAIILAGGLDPTNVTQAIKRVRPFAVDVSSGVEQSPGVKSAESIESFISQVYLSR